jgi:hypothetical protein
MDLQAWRKGEEFKLPSGLVVWMKRATLLDLVARGQIPVALTAQTEELLNAGALKVENFKEFAPILDLLARACITEPPITDAPGDGSIGIDELSSDDKLAIFGWASAEAAPLQKFRGEQTQPVGTAPAGKNVQPAAQ